jgi:hypothetical protein
MCGRFGSWRASWPIVSVVLHKDSRPNASYRVINMNSIFAEFLKAMFGNVNVAAEHERLNTAQNLAHAVAPSPHPARHSASKTRVNALMARHPPHKGEGEEIYSAACTPFLRLFSRRPSTGARNAPV